MRPIEVNFDQERAWWDIKGDSEETDFADERINRLLRWRLLERYLPGVNTILDVGGGTGSFSIPLARRGFDVTHVDFSSRMIEIAKKKAGNLPNLRFRLVNAADLRPFADQAFDLVLNMDGAISFCGTAAEKSIAESCRVAKRIVIVTVSNAAWMVPVWLAESIKMTGRIIPAVKEMLQSGFWHNEQYPENRQLVAGYFGTLKAFLPDELTTLLRRNGMQTAETRALGSMANLSADVLDRITGDRHLLDDFLDMCEEYDTRVNPGGPGTKQRAGLVSIGQREH